MEAALLDRYEQLQRVANYAKTTGKLYPYEPLEEYVSAALFDPQFRNTTSVTKSFWWARAKYWKQERCWDKYNRYASSMWSLSYIDTDIRYGNKVKNLREILIKKLKGIKQVKGNIKEYLTIYDGLVEGDMQKELAKKLGTSQQAVQQRIRYLRQYLREILDK